MLFFSFFKTLVGQQVVVELKNGISLQGELISVDQYLNVKLNKLTVAEEKKYPQLACLKNCFVRGSVIRYVCAEALSFALGEGRLHPASVSIILRKSLLFSFAN